MIASSGIPVTGFQTLEDVHAQLGTPDASVVGIPNEGSIPKGTAFYEDYFTHRKVATPYLEPGHTMFLVMTLGTAELVLVPTELCVAAKRTIFGQSIRVFYNTDGKILDVQLDKEKIEHIRYVEYLDKR